MSIQSQDEINRQIRNRIWSAYVEAKCHAEVLADEAELRRQTRADANFQLRAAKAAKRWRLGC